MQDVSSFGAERPAVVLEFGDCHVSVGLSGEPVARVVMHNEQTCARARPFTPALNINHCPPVDGHRRLLNYLSNTICDAYIRRVQLNPGERRLVVALSVFAPTYIDDLVKRACFERLGVPSVAFVSSEFAALVALECWEHREALANHHQAVVSSDASAANPLRSSARLAAALAAAKSGPAVVPKNAKLAAEVSNVSGLVLSWGTAATDVSCFYASCYVPETMASCDLCERTLPPLLALELQVPLDVAREALTAYERLLSSPERRAAVGLAEGDDVGEVELWTPLDDVEGAGGAVTAGAVRDAVSAVLLDVRDADSSPAHLALGALLRCPVDARYAVATRLLVLAPEHVLDARKLVDVMRDLVTADEQYAALRGLAPHFALKIGAGVMPLRSVRWIGAAALGAGAASTDAFFERRRSPGPSP